MSKKLRIESIVALILLLLTALFAVLFSPRQSFNLSASQAVPKQRYDFSRGYADLIETLLPAVVNISTVQLQEVKVQSPLSYFFNMQPDDSKGFRDPFKDFFGDFGGGEETVKRKTSALGSGFVVDESGYIVTNYHVVENANEIKVTLFDKTELKAKLIGSDPKTDLALIKVESKKKLKYVRFGDSEKARVGDVVIAIGNPFGLGESVSTGIISAKSRSIGFGPLDDFLQTDAAINRGNSGGPMFNLDGDVIGINAAILSPSGVNIGIGFAVPSSMAKSVIEHLKSNKKINRGWLGVSIQAVTDEIADSLYLKSKEGAFVVEVTKGSPADKAGIKPQDVVTGFEDKVIKEPADLSRFVASNNAGKSVKITLQRKGKPVSVSVLLGEQKETKGVDDGKHGSEAQDSSLSFGLTLSNITDDLRKRYKIDEEKEGVLIMKVSQQHLENGSKLQKGDIIQGVSGEKVRTIKEFESQVKLAVNGGRKYVLLTIYRNGALIYETLQIKKDEAIIAEEKAK